MIPCTTSDEPTIDLVKPAPKLLQVAMGFRVRCRLTYSKGMRGTSDNLNQELENLCLVNWKCFGPCREVH